MSIHMTYDGDQHCTGSQPNGKMVAVDCDRTGKGEELYPDNLVGAGLAGCMLLSMGGVAKREGLDISGTEVDVDISLVSQPERRIGAIDVKVNMPRNYSEADRVKLERAANACPIKHSFRPDVRLSTKFQYPRN